MSHFSVTFLYHLSCFLKYPIFWIRGSVGDVCSYVTFFCNVFFCHRFWIFDFWFWISILDFGFRFWIVDFLFRFSISYFRFSDHRFASNFQILKLVLYLSQWFVNIFLHDLVQKNWISSWLLRYSTFSVQKRH